MEEKGVKERRKIDECSMTDRGVRGRGVIVK